MPPAVRTSNNLSKGVSGPGGCTLGLKGVHVLGNRPFPGFPGAGGFPPGFPGAPGPGGNPFPAFDTTAKPAGKPSECDCGASFLCRIEISMRGCCDCTV